MLVLDKNRNGGAVNPQNPIISALSKISTELVIGWVVAIFGEKRCPYIDEPGDNVCSHSGESAEKVLIPPWRRTRTASFAEMRMRECLLRLDVYVINNMVLLVKRMRLSSSSRFLNLGTSQF